MMTYAYLARISIIMLLLEILEIQAHRIALVYQVHPKGREKNKEHIKTRSEMQFLHPSSIQTNETFTSVLCITSLL